MPSPNTMPIKVTVEYDKHGARVTKTFNDMHTAKRFYVEKFKAGKRPRICSREGETEKR